MRSRKETAGTRTRSIHTNQSTQVSMTYEFFSLHFCNKETQWWAKV